MNRLWKGRFRWGRLLLVWLVFLLLAGALFAERSGVQYTAAHVQIGALDHALTKEEALAGQAPVCLLLCDSRQVSVAEAKEQLEQILQDMKVPAEAADLADTAPEALPAFENYETIVVLVPNFEPLGLRLLDLMDWVEQGGNVLFAMTPEKCGAFDVVAQKLGVLASAWNCKTAESIVPAEGFLLGGGQRDAVDLDAAGVDRLQPVDRPAQRGLAGSGGAEHHDDLAARHVQVDAAQHVHRAEVLVDRGHADHRRIRRGCGHARSLPRSGVPAKT